MRMLTYEDLRGRGIPFSATHIHYLVKRGQFPCPIKFGYSTKRWVESEIDAWIADGMKRPKRLKMAKPAALAMAEASLIPLND